MPVATFIFEDQESGKSLFCDRTQGVDEWCEPHQFYLSLPHFELNTNCIDFFKPAALPNSATAGWHKRQAHPPPWHFTNALLSIPASHVS